MPAPNKQKEEVVPILAAVAMQQAAGGDEKLKELLTALLEDQIERRKQEKEKAKRLAEQAVQAAQEYERMVLAKQSTCSHTKQDGRTRLAGQRVSGDGRVCLVCQFCFKTFWHPAKEGENPVPAGLMPPSDEIGG